MYFNFSALDQVAEVAEVGGGVGGGCGLQSKLPTGQNGVASSGPNLCLEVMVMNVGMVKISILQKKK